VGKPRRRWEAAVWTNAVVLIQIPDWKVASRSREVWVRRSGRPWPEKELNCTTTTTTTTTTLVVVVVVVVTVMAHTNQILFSCYHTITEHLGLMLTASSASNVIIASVFLCFQVLFCGKWQWRTVTEVLSRDRTDRDFPHNLSLNNMHKSMSEPKMIFTREQTVTTGPAFSRH
jgi:hypothetical protein